jgi:hypothetical protein
MLLDWIALFIGTIGTFLWARNGAYAKYAGIFWLISSFFWCAYAYIDHQTALGGRDLLSVSLYLYAIYKQFLEKRL